MNLIEAGKHYGWPEIRGEETKAGMIAPVIQAGTALYFTDQQSTTVAAVPARTTIG